MIRDKRIAIVHASLVLFAVALMLRAAHVQLWQGDEWRARAQRQHFAAAPLPAPRGDILDATGTPLARSNELVRVSVTPRDVRDPRRLARALGKAGVDPAWVRRALDKKRAWVDLPGHFMPSSIAAAQMRGVHLTAVGDRDYAESPGVRSIVGRIGPDGKAVDGIELALDGLLRGESGSASLLRDARGRRFESPLASQVLGREGHSIVLTINQALQHICDRALGDAVARLGASGGDIVVLDPHTGEILAMATKRSDPRSTASTALTEPFEPGSTLKPFLAGALLSRKRARVDEVIETFNGQLTLHGRTIRDVHGEARMSLRDVIRFSSNVGIVRFSERLTRGEQYETLRDFGFGSPTGVPYPTEAPGILREPRAWSKQSAASLAMGYEIAVTPLQLAAAYASIANGGELLAPALVKEIRSPDGTVKFRHARRVVRRVLPQAIARELREMLVGVVDSGTATDADLATFAVGGKSGTARRTSGGRYAVGSYTASFVGLFPADDPQYVILVKLDNPDAANAYYGGKVAAPVSKVVLEAAIAARDAALDRGALAAKRVERSQLAVDAARETARSPAAGASGVFKTIASTGSNALAAGSKPLEESTGSVPYVVSLSTPRRASPGQVRVREVPDVRGLPLRTAVRALHHAGFRVQLATGALGATTPPAGTPARTGSVVRLFRP